MVNVRGYQMGCFEINDTWVVISSGGSGYVWNLSLEHTTTLNMEPKILFKFYFENFDNKVCHQECS